MLSQGEPVVPRDSEPPAQPLLLSIATGFLWVPQALLLERLLQHTKDPAIRLRTPRVPSPPPLKPPTHTPIRPEAPNPSQPQPIPVPPLRRASPAEDAQGAMPLCLDRSHRRRRPQRSSKPSPAPPRPPPPTSHATRPEPAPRPASPRRTRVTYPLGPTWPVPHCASLLRPSPTVEAVPRASLEARVHPRVAAPHRCRVVSLRPRPAQSQPHLTGVAADQPRPILSVQRRPTPRVRRHASPSQETQSTRLPRASPAATESPQATEPQRSTDATIEPFPPLCRVKNAPPQI